MRFNKKRLSKDYLFSKLNKNLLIFGTNSILALLNKYYSYFEFIILPNNYSSKKINNLFSLASKLKINIINDSTLLNYFSTDDFKISSIAVLSKNISNLYSIDEVIEIFQEKKFITSLILHDIDYVHNLGAVFRTAYAFGIDFIIVSNSNKQNIYSPVVTKISMGTNYLVPIVIYNTIQSLHILKKNGFQLIALDMEGENIKNILYNDKVCFVLGNEGEGVSKVILSKVDEIIAIPISKDVDSLNVSVVAGIVMYDRIIAKKDI